MPTVIKARDLLNGHRGVLLLDVDGPLNPYAAKPSRRPDGYRSYRYTRDGRFVTGRDFRREKGLRVWLNPTHGAQILNVAEDAALLPVWASTWMDEANAHISPAIGLPQLHVVQFAPETLHPTQGWIQGAGWKWRTIANWAAGVPLAWWDDECNDTSFAEERKEFLRQRGTLPTLLCHVNPARGLSHEHFERVRTWARTLPASP